jgi:hypothetical protein
LRKLGILEQIVGGRCVVRRHSDWRRQ